METFAEMPLPQAIHDSLVKIGYEKPTPVQQKAIPLLLSKDSDLVALAQTGTGKTCAFGLPLLSKIDMDMHKVQTVVLCPTRELCLQVCGEIQNFGQFMKDLLVTPIYGGASRRDQARALKRGPQVLVATPGRMKDFLESNEVDFSNVKIVVLDEADEMLDMGFQDELDAILEATPKTKQTWLFSATMPTEVRRIAERYMSTEEEIQCGGLNKGNANIEHEFCLVKPKDKYPALKRFVDYNPEMYGIVFTRTKNDAQETAEQLIRDGYNADALHGDLSQVQRDKVMQRFRDKSLQVLVATDVAARGIDVNNLTHVIHYSLPDDNESYTHRSGRTARAGRTGVSLALITARDERKIRTLEKITGKSFEKINVPTGFEVCEKQLIGIVHKIHNVEVNEELIEPYLPRIFQEFEEMSKEEILRRFASLEFNLFLDYYKDAEDLNPGAARRKDRGERSERGERPERGERGERGERFGRERGERGDRGERGFGAEAGYKRLFINVGAVDDFHRGDLLRLICDGADINSGEIGRIDLRGTHTFFDVRESHAEKVVGSFDGAMIRGRSLRVNDADSAPPERGERSDRGDRGPRRERSFGGDRGDRGPRRDRGEGFGGGSRSFGDSQRGGRAPFRSREGSKFEGRGERPSFGDRKRRD